MPSSKRVAHEAQSAAPRKEEWTQSQEKSKKDSLVLIILSLLAYLTNTV